MRGDCHVRLISAHSQTRGRPGTLLSIRILVSITLLLPASYLLCLSADIRKRYQKPVTSIRHQAYGNGREIPDFPAGYRGLGRCGSIRRSHAGVMSSRAPGVHCVKVRVTFADRQEGWRSCRRITWHKKDVMK
jgi:hypothetical protein